jgi:hypothetical protein
MAEDDKRKSKRKPIFLTTYIRKELPGGGYSLMQFMSRDLSEGGIYISADDLSLFDLGEELSIIVDRDRERLFEGKAKVVRSARVFESEDNITESGYGLMFSGVGGDFTDMVKKKIADGN